MTTAIAHDLIVSFFVLVGVWAVVSLCREECSRIQRARKIFKAWRRG